MKRTGVLVTVVAAAAACAVIATAAGTQSTTTRTSTRTFLLTWTGTEALSYDASDSTPFDIQRAGYSGCKYTQQGNTRVDWRDVWRLTVVAKIGKHFGHLKFVAAKRVSGPVDPKGDTSSQISGSNTDSGTTTECSDSGRAGAFNCTAESVKPHPPHVFGHLLDPDPKIPSTEDVYPDGFSSPSASYTGQQPSGQWTCAGNIGRNAFPGGFVSGDFGGLYSDGFFRISAATILALKRGRTYEDKSAILPDSKSWLFHAFASPGDSCVPTSDTDGACTYTKLGTNRVGELFLKRIR
jgi:hypothetical protein